MVRYAVRARDVRGALSPWSAVQTVEAVASGPVTVGGEPAPSLADAVAAARPGDVVSLGAGAFPLAHGMTLPAGVRIQGAGPHLTFIDGGGRDRAVVMAAGDTGSSISDVTIRNAHAGIVVEAGANATIENVVIRDCDVVGVDVAGGATAVVRSSTLYQNEIGARSAGALTVRGSIVTGGGRGLVAAGGGTVASSYNDFYANRAADYDGLAAGTGDLAVPPAFVDPAGGDLHVTDGAPTTDRGDPADDFSREPAPSGGRINMGAYAGTAGAEKTVMAPAAGNDGGVGETLDGGATAPDGGAGPVIGSDAGSAAAPDGAANAPRACGASRVCGVARDGGVARAPHETSPGVGGAVGTDHDDAGGGGGCSIGPAAGAGTGGVAAALTVAASVAFTLAARARARRRSRSARSKSSASV